MKVLVNARGQATIPKALRDQFGISPGQKIQFVADEDGIVLRKVIDRKLRDSVVGSLKEELAAKCIRVNG